jgi:hypothetical protein
MRVTAISQDVKVAPRARIELTLTTITIMQMITITTMEAIIITMVVATPTITIGINNFILI